MSSFNFPAKSRKTGKVVRVDGLDDYFGQHQYGYRVEGTDEILDEETFYQEYDEVKGGVPN